MVDWDAALDVGIVMTLLASGIMLLFGMGGVVVSGIKFFESNFGTGAASAFLIIVGLFLVIVATVAHKLRKWYLGDKYV